MLLVVSMKSHQTKPNLLWVELLAAEWSNFSPRTYLWSSVNTAFLNSLDIAEIVQEVKFLSDLS